MEDGRQLVTNMKGDTLNGKTLNLVIKNYPKND